MNILKERTKSKLLSGLQALDKRMNLSLSDKNYLFNLEKGYAGEELFDSLVKKHLSMDCLVLNDLLLDSGGKSFQVDCVVITSNSLNIYEIKNYKGNYQFSAGHLSTLTGQEIVSPVLQIKRSNTLMKELIKDFGSELSVKSSIVFVHPSFSLYLAKPTDPFILPNQVERHLIELSQHNFSLTKKHRYMADKLLREHREEVPYQKHLPDYNLKTLNQNLYCPGCNSSSLILTKCYAKCRDCKYKTTKDELVMDHIKDYKLLFPDEKVTVRKIRQWCGNKIRPRKIRDILIDRFDKKGKTSNTYYV
ncbi:nuclease-related domain-containing protein [Alkalibacterium kapii]|uniref:NERD domain-containing protein n=1 Tax=Alkalibacterium kapii TaxID=426704 RepID=A0A511AVH5_9LACT|nr:nuclease-related domain-containing protein [Alkalibacterium kapii]GEK92208.1 hypothetical protein AKA01nite_18300 [Alkalibacterium kapii]